MRARRTGPARHRKDSNLSVIVGAAKAAGFLVYPINNEFADLLVQMTGVLEAWEVKRDSKAPYTDGQKELLAMGWRIRRVESVEDVIARRGWILNRKYAA